MKIGRNVPFLQLFWLKSIFMQLSEEISWCRIFTSRCRSRSSSHVLFPYSCPFLWMHFPLCPRSILFWILKRSGDVKRFSRMNAILQICSTEVNIVRRLGLNYVCSSWIIHNSLDLILLFMYIIPGGPKIIILFCTKWMLSLYYYIFCYIGHRCNILIRPHFPLHIKGHTQIEYPFVDTPGVVQCII